MNVNVRRLARSRWVIVLAAVFLGVIGALVATSFQDKQYEAQYQLFVAPAKSGSPLEDYQGSFYAKDRIVSYVQLLQTEWLAQKTIDALDLDLTPAQLVSSLTVEAEAQSVIINIKVRSGDPTEAVRIAKGVSETFRSEVALLDVPTDGGGPAVAIRILPGGGVPTDPVSPKPKVNMAIGALAGLLIGFGAYQGLERFAPRRKPADDRMSADTDADAVADDAVADGDRSATE